MGPTSRPTWDDDPIDLDAIGPAIGSRFPDVVLPDQTGRTVSVHDHRNGQPCLVIVYRSADW